MIGDFVNKHDALRKLKNHIRHRFRVFKAKRFYKKDIHTYNKLNYGQEFIITKKDLYPCYNDMYENASGNVDDHYFLQDIYMAEKVCRNMPEVHYDIGSRMDGFIAHLISSTNIKRIVMLDIRPFEIKLPRLQFIQTDATNLSELEDESVDSISSLHAIEHFGLGRYGDEVSPKAWEQALNSIQRVVKPGGYFYFSVPVGPQNKVCFNAHRIFQPSLIVKTLDKMELISFAYIHNYEVVEMDLNLAGKAEEEINEYDCGMFVFKKYRQ